jgi:hypothetical protein
VRTLALDIETSPSLAYVWQLWDQGVPLDRLVNSGEVLCFAAKWLGDKKIHFSSVHGDGRLGMLTRAHELLDDADAVLHYNGQRFDIPHLNREFVSNGFTPPSPYKQIDLYQVVKRQFKFVSNKLAHVAPELGLEGKVQHSGFRLWVRCMAGDAKAWREMERYNRQDVRLLEELYEILLPWIPGHPNRQLYDLKTGCPLCGHDHLVKRGFAYTALGKFQQLHCQGCGAYVRSGKRLDGADLRRVV